MNKLWKRGLLCSNTMEIKRLIYSFLAQPTYITYSENKSVLIKQMRSKNNKGYVYKERERERVVNCAENHRNLTDRQTNKSH